MQYQNRKYYEKMMDYFFQVDKKQIQENNFVGKIEEQNLVLIKLNKLDNIQKSYYKDNSFVNSQFYESFGLINALNIIQQNMSNLKLIFEQRDDELFGVWLWDQGEQHLVIVDNQVPCLQNGNQTELATLKSKYEWPIILQKAIGKQLGYGYDSFNLIKNDNVDFFIQMITGQIVNKQAFQSIEELEMKSKEKNITLYVQYVQDSKTIASIIEFPLNNNSSKMKLIKLIAPSKEFVYFKGNQKEDKSCYLNWIEFKENFNTVYVLDWNDDYRVISLQLQNQIERKSNFIEHTYLYNFKIDEQANYQITLWQKDYIINQDQIEILNQNQRNRLGLIRILLFKEQKSNQYQFIDGKCDFKNNIQISQILDKGDYSLLCQGYFNYFQNYSLEQKEKQCQLNLTIKGLLVPKQIDQDNSLEQKCMKLIISLIKNQCSLSNTRQIYQPQIQVTTNQKYGLLYFYYENRGTIDICEEINFKDLGHLIYYESLKKINLIQAHVKQNHFKVILFTLDPQIILKQNATNFPYEYTLQLQKEQYQDKIKQQVNSEIVELNFNKGKVQYDQIDVLINQHNQGILIQFQNNQECCAKIDVIFTELKNLSLVYNQEYTIKGLTIQFSIQKGTKFFMLFDIIEPKNKYYYKFDMNCIYLY